MMKQGRKVLVFDVDGTLLFRTMQKLNNVQQDFKTKGRFIYLRPNLHHLAFHFEKLNQKSMILLWTSMMRKNAQQIHKRLCNLGLNFQKLYTQQNCLQNLTKDLRVVASDLNVDVNDIYLIDDSIHKRIDNQNFIAIKEYEGKDSNDNQMIRIVKQLYKVLQMPFQQKFIQEAQVFNLQYKMKKLSLKEDKKNENQNIFQQKHEKKHGKQEKNLRYREKNLRYQEKTQKDQVYKQNIQQKPMKFTNLTKVIVFDLNKTLVAKRKELDNQIQHLINNYKIQGNLIYNRPYIHFLQKFRQAHPQHEIKYFAWTTMTGKKVQKDCKDVINSLGANFQGILNGVENNQGAGKDLRIITEKYGCSLQNTILVDDSQYKNVNNQNYIKILPYNGQKQDLQMIRIVSRLDQFIKCKNQNCQIKQLLKNHQKQLIWANNKYLSAEQGKKQQQKKLKIYNKDAVNSNVKNEKSIQCLVFDINETLLVRTTNKINNIPIDGKNRNYNIYLRPHLQTLCSFLQSLNIQVCLWSTIRSYNCGVFEQLLKEKGLKYFKLLSQEDLIDGKKDLKLVSQLTKIPMQKIVLIDDNPNKSIQGQNYIQITSFDAQNEEDKCLLLLIEQLRRICEQKFVKKQN